MNNTYNISLPAQLDSLAKLQISQGLYSSLNELMRDALRRLLGIKPAVYTENGLTQRDEKLILQSDQSDEVYQLFSKQKLSQSIKKTKRGKK